MAARTPRTGKLHLRVSRATKRTLETAASVSNRSLTASVLESALARADETLVDRRAFVLTKPQWTAFLAALDPATRSLPCMQPLLTEPGFFDSGAATKTDRR